MPRKVTAEERRQKAIAKEEAKRLRYASYIEQAKKIHPTYGYDDVEFDHNEKGVLILKNVLCPVHGYYTVRKDVHINQRCECPDCKGYPNHKTPEEWKKIFIDRAIKKFGPNRFDYSRVEYTNKYKPVWIRCIDHDYWFQTRLDEHSRKAGGCPLCTQSSGEASIRTYLDAYNLQYHAQWQIDNDNIFCKRQYLVIDFYVPEYSLFIEFNGIQHYEDVPHFFDKGFTFADQQERDETVRLYCKQKNIHLLEIKYTQEQNISKILDEWFARHSKDIR